MELDMELELELELELAPVLGLELNNILPLQLPSTSATTRTGNHMLVKDENHMWERLVWFLRKSENLEWSKSKKEKGESLLITS